MQVNKINFLNQISSCSSQNVVSRPISFGFCEPRAYICEADKEDSVDFPSITNIINSKVAEKEGLFARTKNEAKETLKQVKEAFNVRTFKSNPMRIEEKNGSYQECFFENENKPFEILKVNKHIGKLTKEFIFHGKNMVSYTEFDNVYGVEKNITPTRGKGFVYTVTKTENGYPEIITSLTVTGARNNNHSTYTTYECGEKKQYIYNAKTCKWSLVQK